MSDYGEPERAVASGHGGVLQGMREAICEAALVNDGSRALSEVEVTNTNNSLVDKEWWFPCSRTWLQRKPEQEVVRPAAHARGLR